MYTVTESDPFRMKSTVVPTSKVSTRERERGRGEGGEREQEKGETEEGGEVNNERSEIIPFSYLVASRILVRRGLNRFSTSSLLDWGSTDLNPGVIPVICEDQRRRQGEGGEEGEEKRRGEWN